jgi:hypothetical protein
MPHKYDPELAKSWQSDGRREEIPYPTRAEFDALVQKVDEIHRMLKNMDGQPNVVMGQPYPVPTFTTSDPVRVVTLPVVVMKRETNGQ